MDYFYFDVLDSTSTKAQQLLRERGPNPMNQPLVVQAGCQTGGRGRRGHEWQSPEGNLYLTLVIPEHERKATSGGDHDKDPHPEGRRSLSPSVTMTPLKVSLLVARWIEGTFGIRITLKWPNDMYLYGGKLGGILVESAVTRDQVAVRWGPLVIGIGLNLNVTPPERTAAVALAEFTGIRADPKTCGLSLARSILTAWEDLPLTQVLREGAPWDIAPGHPWVCQKTGDLWLQDQVGPEGTLSLRKPHADVVKTSIKGEVHPEKMELVSSHHTMRWAYTRLDQKRDMKAQTPLIIADVGNSRLKVGFFADYQDPRPAWVLSMGRVDGEALQIKLGNQSGVQKGWPVHILSVNPQNSDLLAKALQKLGLTPVLVKKRTTRIHPNVQNPYRFEELGVDRIAAMEGFLAHLSPQQRVNPPWGVVIAAGTATTIDFVSPRGQHEGGVILPGIELSLKTLHRETGLLPLAPPHVSNVGLGHSTISALSQGVIGMTVGAVSLLKEKLITQGESIPKTNDRWDVPVQVTITGGLRQSLAPHFPECQIDQDLILSGGRYMVLSGG